MNINICMKSNQNVENGHSKVDMQMCSINQILCSCDKVINEYNIFFKYDKWGQFKWSYEFLFSRHATSSKGRNNLKNVAYNINIIISYIIFDRMKEWLNIDSNLTLNRVDESNVNFNSLLLKEANILLCYGKN